LADQPQLINRRPSASGVTPCSIGGARQRSGQVGESVAHAGAEVSESAFGTRVAHMHGVFLRLVLAVLLLVAAVAHAHHAAPQAVLRDANASGVIATVSTGGVIDPANPFFQSVGRNGRACVSCPAPAEGWATTPAGAQAPCRTRARPDPAFPP